MCAMFIIILGHRHFGINELLDAMDGKVSSGSKKLEKRASSGDGFEVLGKIKRRLQGMVLKY